MSMSLSNINRVVLYQTSSGCFYNLEV